MGAFASGEFACCSAARLLLPSCNIQLCPAASGLILPLGPADCLGGCSPRGGAAGCSGVHSDAISLLRREIRYDRDRSDREGGRDRDRRDYRDSDRDADRVRAPFAGHTCHPSQNDVRQQEVRTLRYYRRCSLSLLRGQIYQHCLGFFLTLPIKVYSYRYRGTGRCPRCAWGGTRLLQCPEVEICEPLSQTCGKLCAHLRQGRSSGAAPADCTDGRAGVLGC